MSETYGRYYNGLPENYWDKQNFCWYIHDIILSIFNNCIENNRMDYEIKFKNKLHAQEFETSEDIFDWLYKNGYGNNADIILGKRIFHAILADMLNFIYESLNTIEKGKITVSLALLRKPLRDNLLYLEWLLGSSKEFIKLVNNSEIDKYAIENVNKHKKINIIKNAINKIDNKDYFDVLNEDVYFDLRYNKAAGNSLQLVWDRANHLVTTRPHHRSNEFNFVFLDNELHLDYIQYYYSQVPHLLFYTYNIIIKLYEKFFRKLSKATKIYNNSLIIYKLSNMIGSTKTNEYFKEEMKVLLNFPCLNCKELIQINENSKEFERFKYGWGFECPKCKNEINTAKYIFLEDYKKTSK